MATIDTLLAQITDQTVRNMLTAEISEMRKRLEWGLVFERHLPEKTLLLSGPIKVGSVVWERRAKKPRRFRVRAIEGDTLAVVEEAEQTTAAPDAEIVRIARSDVLVEVAFTEQVFPVITSLDAVRNGSIDKPHHAVIQGENYHAIEVLLTAYAQSFDVIYLDPPYNTGSKDWAYNNDYVDPNDTYRPSKWLAFMERRLKIARKLLRPDGVLIVTIDENEVHHLGMLLEQLFPGYIVQMVTIVINPKGTGKLNFARVDEYAFFVMPDTGTSVVRGLPKSETQPMRANRRVAARVAEPVVEPDELVDEDPEQANDEDVETADDAETDEEAGWPFPPEERGGWELRHARRRGGESSYRAQRPNQFYPLWIDADTKRVVRAGESIPLEDAPSLDPVEGLIPVWPIDREGNHRCWYFISPRMNELIEQRRVVLGRQNPETGSWTVNFWVRSTTEMKPKTVWWDTRHDAGTHGTILINHLLGNRGAFSFPKSVYAVRDALAMVVRDRPDAKILDFFAGSGTTLHATMLLNRDYPGQRQCVLVTNNELNYKTAARLMSASHFRGDPEFERAGVFQAATKPRITAALTGRRPDGSIVTGEYADRRLLADGFPENVEFFRLDYEDPSAIEFGLRFEQIHPLLWLMAGGIGVRETLDPDVPLGLPANSPYAVLFDPAGLHALVEALPARPDITHVFIVADSADGFAQARGDLPESLRCVRLYRDYLEGVRGATR